jgi:predicted amidophosphoribosyltransferase
MWMYRDRVCDAVVAAKYAHNAPLADALGHRLGRRVWSVLGDDPPAEVTFVPSHLFRQISRGGIGTRAIAQSVAEQLKIPIRQRLKAIRPIAKQAWLSDDDRKQNVCGAFAARKSYAFARSPKLDDRHILVVDDVLTTGATANEVAGVLKDAGAGRVTIAVVSRAVRTR